MSERNQLYTPYIRDRNEQQQKRAEREATPKTLIAPFIAMALLSPLFFAAFVVSPVMGLAMTFFFTLLALSRAVVD